MQNIEKSGINMIIQVQRTVTRSKITLGSLLLALMLSIVAAGSAAAQFGSASVLGYVRDNSGAYVANTKVTLINVATNVTQTADTDKDGKYEFDSVPIGNYQVSTERRRL